MTYFLFHKVNKVKHGFSQRKRRERMAMFIEVMELKGGETVIDLGGTPVFWEDCATPLKITIINLPGINPPKPNNTIHEIKLLHGDACSVDMFDNMSFEIAFSNSVIEHVGDETKQSEMACEVKRLAPRYWIQTPSIWFPIEAHNNMPFWWFWPHWLQNLKIKRWRRRLPAWCRMVEETRVLRRGDFHALFDDGEIWVERSFGFTKSYTIYKL